MKHVLFALSLLASATAAGAYPVCISFAPAGYCDAMQFDGKKNAVWVNHYCNGVNSAQTSAKYKKKLATTTCDGASGCEPAAGRGWDSLEWVFHPKSGFGSLIGRRQGNEEHLVVGMPVDVIEGACTPVEGGRSTLDR